MKKFLNISLFILAATLIINFSKINYSASLIDHPNSPFFYSGLASIIGILIVLIIKKIRILSKN